MELMMVDVHFEKKDLPGSKKYIVKVSDMNNGHAEMAEKIGTLYPDGYVIGNMQYLGEAEIV